MDPGQDLMRRRIPDVPEILVPLDPQSAVPMHRQIYEALRGAILQERLAAGARLPSSRALATELQVGRNTVTAAFAQLRAEGYITTHSGGGTRVRSVLPERLLQLRGGGAQRPRSPGSRSVPTPALSRRGAALVEASRHFPAAAQPVEAFRLGVPAVDEFPKELWARLVARRWRRPPPLGMGDPAGYEPLRRAVAEYVRVARGVQCTWEQVVIVSGSQHGLELTARLLLDPGDEVWIEDPGYPGPRSALHGAAARLVPVPVDAEGLSVEEGRRLGGRARLAYVTPSHQFPLGVVMSVRRRLALLAWARETGAWIVEDDYDSEFRYAGRPLPPLQSLDADGRVLYQGTFSKTLFPALRLGYLVLPGGLVDAFAAARSLADRHAPTVDQAVVADFLDEGHFARHVRLMRLVYAERQESLVSAAARELAGVLDVRPAEGGMHLVGRLPDGADDVAAAARAARRGVAVDPLSPYATAPSRQAALLL